MSKFAYIYDKFTDHVDYRSWYKFLRRYIKKTGSILDVGCGSASITKYFYDDKFITTGLDISSSMLEVAKSKEENIEYILADITDENLNLNRKFDYITCNFDTVNYFDSYNAFERFLKNVSSMQNKGGILIFDLVTEEIFDEIFYNNLFIDDGDNYLSIWQYEKLEKENTHQIDIDIFYKENDMYTKYSETYIKYIFDIERVIGLLQDYGYMIYDVAKNAKYGESRIFIISKKES